MATKTLKIGSLLLDQNNPRIPAVNSQREALQQVLDDQEEKLANLAESIVEEGLSPTDVWLVTRSPTAQDKFIVLEGNRRLAALKILQNPNVLTGLNISNALQRRFERAEPPPARLIHDPWGAEWTGYSRVRRLAAAMPALAQRLSQPMWRWLLYMQVRTYALDQEVARFAEAGG